MNTDMEFIFMYCIGPHWSGANFQTKRITEKEEKEKNSLTLSWEVEELMPELVGHSNILSDEQMKKLAQMVPARAQVCPWELLYSTATDGFSLNTMYRQTLDVDCDNLCLLVIKDSKDNIFGALLTTPPSMSLRKIKGTGETFLWTFTPTLKKFAASYENDYYHNFTTSTIMVGYGKGTGLFLDDSLYNGRTTKCNTFNNDPLTTEEHFTIKGVEVWSVFQSY